MKKQLHVISFDIPYPANYGGAIDVYYRLKALYENGVEITLHCFEYRVNQDEELEKICKKVYYYKRNISVSAHFSYLPYAVFSRKHPELLNNLLKDDYPIIFEGLMSCYYLNNSKLKHRNKIIRQANIEHEYYLNLAKSTLSLKNKIYYYVEALKFRLFEKNIRFADTLLAVSQTDADYLSSRFPSKKMLFIPCFHANNELSSICGQSDYILYQGNLAVAENEIAAIYLCREVFSKIKFKCIIAGLNPTKRLQKIVSEFQNISLVSNPSEDEMKDLTQHAQINALVSFQPTGLKLKILNTLFSGRHVLANTTILEGTGLHSLCHVSDNCAGQIELCKQLMQIPFIQDDIDKRKNLLFPQFSNAEQAKIIIDLI